MPLRRGDVCVVCGTVTPVQSQARWNAHAKSVTCPGCRPEVAPTLMPPPVAIEDTWGTGSIGRLAKFMSDKPPSRVAWAKGADGKRPVAEWLSEELADVAIVLHDRKVPKIRGNIDHLVIAPSGVWVIDAKNYQGKVERRDVGGWFSTDVRLHVNGSDRTKLVDGLGWQVQGVRAALEPIGAADIAVHPTVCFAGSEWGWFAKPFQIDDVLIAWAARLTEAIRAPGPYDRDAIITVAHQLSRALPASK